MHKHIYTHTFCLHEKLSQLRSKGRGLGGLGMRHKEGMENGGQPYFDDLMQAIGNKMVRIMQSKTPEGAHLFIFSCLFFKVK